jgi:hypothetical protein
LRLPKMSRKGIIMLIFIDARAPQQAKEALEKYGEVVDFITSDICYDAIAGHPDIFMFQHPGGLVVAPNLPPEYKNRLIAHGVKFKTGIMPVGSIYPATAAYNALYTTQGILHNQYIIDEVVAGSHAMVIHCRQGYVRCSTVLIGETFITSDKGIEKELLAIDCKVLYVNPQNIALQGVKYGFFGGCLGVYSKKVYFCGAIKYLEGNKILANQIENEGFELIELYQGPVTDVGGIFFIPAS